MFNSQGFPSVSLKNHIKELLTEDIQIGDEGFLNKNNNDASTKSVSNEDSDGGTKQTDMPQTPKNFIESNSSPSKIKDSLIQVCNNLSGKGVFLNIFDIVLGGH